MLEDDDVEVVQSYEDQIEDARRSLASKAHYDKALACFRRACRFKKEPDIRTALAQPQLLRCQRLLEAALWELPENRTAHFLLTAVLMQLGSFAAAKREAVSLLQNLEVLSRWHENKDPVLHQVIAHTSWRLDKDEEAMSQLLDATNDFPEYPQLCLNLSELLLSARCHTSARDMAQLALLRNSSDWCKSHLSDAGQERATCCLSLALRELGSSLDEAVQLTRTLRVKDMSEHYLEQHCRALMTRLRTRGKATSSCPREGPLESKKHDSTQALRPNAHVEADASRELSRQAEPDGLPDRTQGEFQAASDPALRRAKLLPNSSPPWSNFGVEYDTMQTPSTKPMMGDLDLLMGLMPLDRPKNSNSAIGVVPSMEPTINPQFGLWCCITDCKQQCRRF